MSTLAAARPQTRSMRDVAFFFLLLYVLSSFSDTRFSIGGKGVLTLSVFEICGYLLLLAAVLAGYVSRSSSEPLCDGKFRCVLLYLAWGLLAAVAVRGETAKLMVFDLKRLVPSVVGYLSILMLVRSRGDLRAVRFAWICAGLVNSALAFSQYLFNGPYVEPPTDIALVKLDLDGELSSTLVSGFFGHPNSFSQVMLPFFVVFATGWLLSDRKCAPRSLGSLALAAVFGTVLLLTSAKGAILWAGIGIGTIFLMSRWKTLRRLRFFLASWFLGVAGINLLALLFVKELELDMLRTLFSRVEFIVTSFYLFLAHPLMALGGGGMSHWEEYCGLWATWEYVNAHNAYLNQMLFFGVVGVAFLILFVLGHVRDALSFGWGAGDPLLSPYPYLAAVLALGGSYFFEPSFADPIQKFQLVFMLAMTETLLRQRRATATAP